MLVASGVFGLVWMLARHVISTPSKVELELTPKYLFRRGSYRFTRSRLFLFFTNLWLYLRKPFVRGIEANALAKHTPESILILGWKRDVRSFVPSAFFADRSGWPCILCLRQGPAAARVAYLSSLR